MKKDIFQILSLLLLSIGISFSVCAQPINLSRVKYSHNGSDTRLVYNSFQDNESYMWFAESGGVSRFDGTNSLYLEHDPQDSASLSNPIAKCIIGDDAGNIWIGTQGGGLNYYDKYTETIRHFRHDPEDSTSLSHDEILCLFIDKSDRLWVGTENGLNLMDREAGTFRRFMPDPADSSALQGRAVLDMVQDRKGVLWATTWDGGLHRIDCQEGVNGKLSVAFTAYAYDPEDPYSLPSPFLWGIYEDPAGRLWVGSYGNGLSVMYPPELQPAGRPADKPAFLKLPYGSVKGTMLSDQIWTLLFDAADRLWVGTANGLAISEPVPPTPDRSSFEKLKELPFQNIFREEFGMRSLPSNKIRNLCRDKEDRIWVATENGISLYDPFTSIFDNYLSKPKVKKRFAVSSIQKDKYGYLWAGTQKKGLIRYDIATGEYIRFHERGTPARSLPQNNIMALYADNENQVWIASPNMLSVIHAGTLSIRNYPIHFPGQAEEVLIQNIRPDHLGYVWLITWSGLVRIEPESMRMRFYFPDPEDPHSLPDPQINDMVVDSLGTMWITSESKGLLAVRQLEDGRLHYQPYAYNTKDMASLLNKSYRAIEICKGGLWVGTMSGLLYFDFITREFSQIGNYQDIRNPIISNLTKGSDEKLWITTASDIYCYDPGSKKFSSFDQSSGLMSQDFIEYASFCDEKGMLYFGGDQGICSINPSDRPKHLPLASVRLDGMQIFNQPIAVGAVGPGNKAPILQTALAYTPRIELAHTQSTIGFTISRLDFTNPEGGKIAYQLEGLEKGWNEQADIRAVTYTHLEPGAYTFKLRVANAEGVWNDQVRELQIYIAPPFWQIWWFRLLIALGGIFLVQAFLLIRTKSIKQQQKELARQVALRTQELAISTEKEKEARQIAESASQAKAQFLSVMSHEIRTPIHAVISMTQFLMDEGPRSDQVEHLNILQFSAQNLLGLINDILDFSKIEADKLELEQISFDLNQLTKSVVKAIGMRGEEKGIEMRYEFDPNLSRQVMGDSTRLGQILTNLLGNAVKFTQEGYISLNVSATAQGGQRFEIRDTGIGIPEDKQALIFEEFSQSSAETTRKFGGTGLGLAISRRLVQIMGSDIQLTSEPGVGSCFFFELNLPESMESTAISADKKVLITPQDLRHLHILMAEDNLINQKIMIRTMDKWGIRMTIANNGKDALDCMGTHNFDLVFMDIQMPEMDGLTATRLLRERGHTLPVIGLSANVGKEDVSVALEAGMTDYLAKPFTAESLADKLMTYLPVRT